MATETEKGLIRRVRLWNRGEKLFDYEIMGERYTIEPGKYKEMARRTAIMVRGFYPGKDIKVNLQIEPITDSGYEETAEIQTNKEKVVKYACFKCDEEFDSKEKLAAHMAEKHTPGRKKETVEA